MVARLGDAPKMAEDRSMTLLERERAALEAAPSHDELVLRLRAVAREALASGASRDEVIHGLDELRRLEPQHRDVALDVLDVVHGWSSPHVRLDRD